MTNLQKLPEMTFALLSGPLGVRGMNVAIILSLRLKKTQIVNLILIGWFLTNICNFYSLRLFRIHFPVLRSSFPIPYDTNRSQNFLTSFRRERKKPHRNPSQCAKFIKFRALFPRLHLYATFSPIILQSLKNICKLPAVCMSSAAQKCVCSVIDDFWKIFMSFNHTSLFRAPNCALNYTLIHVSISKWSYWEGRTKLVWFYFVLLLQELNQFGTSFRRISWLMHRIKGFIRRKNDRLSFVRVDHT